MAEVSWMKMTFQGLATGGRKGVSGGESSPLRRRDAGHQGRVKMGQIGIWQNMCAGRAGHLYNLPYRRK